MTELIDILKGNGVIVPATPIIHIRAGYCERAKHENFQVVDKKIKGRLYILKACPDCMRRMVVKIRKLTKVYE